jgi:very-short-patch-repair endonuclease
MNFEEDNKWKSKAEEEIAPYIRRIAKDMDYLFTWNDQSIRYYKGKAPFGEPLQSKQTDFVLSGQGKHINIEVDGRKWHHYAKDVERDSVVLKEGLYIIRVTAKDCIENPSMVSSWIMECLKNHDWNKSRIAYLGKDYDFLSEAEYSESQEQDVIKKRNWWRNSSDGLD